MAEPPSPLAEARLATGHTQVSLARAVGVERTTVIRWEKGTQFPAAWHLQGLAGALRISVDKLRNLLDATEESARTPTGSAVVTAPTSVVLEVARQGTGTSDVRAHEPAPVDVIHAAIPRLRRALDRLSLPDDGPPRDLAELSGEVTRANDNRLQSRYGNLARGLPDLITDLARAGHDGDAGRRRHVAALFTLALRAADGLAFKFGYLDLSARLIDLMRSAARLAEDPLLLAVVAYVHTETFFATGDLDTAARALEHAADQVPALGTTSSLAALGALHMRAAVVAGRANKPDRAADHLREARRAATAVPEGVYQGTAFGPASLRIHELAVAVELRDPLGIERASDWHPPDQLPAERRSHYYIDLARAHLTLGRHEHAYQSLQAARIAAPEHARNHPQVRDSLSALLRTHPSPEAGLLDLAAWARAC
ncbi:helix-turn-helix domain-containing protein [Saccharothrix sp. AJ9571]|nr:helix-turn-helix domain-containing protein [Saccharothrix sp. AJ9571]